MAYKDYDPTPHVQTPAEKAWVREQKKKMQVAIDQHEANKRSASFSDELADGTSYPIFYYFGGEIFRYSGATKLWAYYTCETDPTRKRLIKPDRTVFNATEFPIPVAKAH